MNYCGELSRMQYARISELGLTTRLLEVLMLSLAMLYLKNKLVDEAIYVWMTYSEESQFEVLYG